jgi:hypothetical protein
MRIYLFLVPLVVWLVVIRNSLAAEPNLSCAAEMDAETALRIGVLLDTGFGVDQDFSMAVQCYRRAALARNRQAEFNLGLMYANGRGVELDPKQAAFWYERAAKQRNGRAAYVLGMMYDQGEGINHDPKAALHWYRVALANGIPAAREKISKLSAVNGRQMRKETEFTDESGRLCRQIVRMVKIDNKPRQARAVLCRNNDDGPWVLIP